MLSDIVEPGLDVVFCGLNPGIEAATTGRHFVGRSNRFWRVLHLSGFTPAEIEPAADRSILSYGLGLTCVVSRPTSSASDVAPSEFHAARESLEGWTREHSPRYLAFLGKAAYAAMRGLRSVPWGLQDERFGGAIAWVLPNPSGRNLAFSQQALIEAFGELQQASRP